MLSIDVDHVVVIMLWDTNCDKDPCGEHGAETRCHQMSKACLVLRINNVLSEVGGGGLLYTYLFFNDQ